MLLDRYEYEVGVPFHQYDFYSDGPKGRIRKAVLYTFIGTRDGTDYYNLGFGDYNEDQKTVNDLSVSNNEDRDKILATVAITTLEFTSHFPDCKIVAAGSTPARTRLYQMGVAKYYKEISEMLDIQGLTAEKGWQSFKGGVNYLALLVSRK
jgi:hypothetical protein